VPEATEIATHENFEQSQTDENLGRQSSIQSQVDLSNQQKQISGLMSIPPGEKLQVVNSPF
jgi:hypothetical protein